MKHFASVCSAGFTPCWAELTGFLRQAQPHFAMAALKTLLNSWCTKGRYHDNSSPRCIFGCLAPDDITHYVSYPLLWRICAQISGTYQPRNVENHILLREPSEESLALLVTAFTTYHALKLGHGHAVVEAERSGDYLAFNALARRLADAQWVKMGSRRRREAAPAGVATPPPREPHPSEHHSILIGAGTVECTAQPHQCFEDGCQPAPFSCEHHSNLIDAGAALAAAGAIGEDERPFCEPECNEYPAGTHHPGCSQAYFDAEGTHNQDAHLQPMSAAPAR